MAEKFDVIVIGAGPGGYVAAIRAAQKGLKTACIEARTNEKNQPVHGGTCLNIGCIPSKALLETTHKLSVAQHHFDEIGLKIKDISADLKQIMAFKQKVIDKNVAGIAMLFQANLVQSIVGHAQLQADHQIAVTTPNAEVNYYQAEHIILAPGSLAVEIAAAPLTEDLIVDSTGALTFNNVPKKLGIIGAGIIGLELGSVWCRLGSEVTILEALPEFLPAVDQQIAQELAKQLANQGLKIELGAKVQKTQISKQSIKISYEQNGKTQVVTFDKLIVCVGRRPNTQGLVSAEVPLALDERGFIIVDDQCKTNLPNIYAVGDAVRGPMLAHKASEEGMMVADLIAGQQAIVNYQAIPNVIYTAPELAWVGKTEQQLQKLGIAYKLATFPFSANGRALANNDSVGLVKMIADKQTDRLLGIHILSQQAGELIAQAVTALEFGASAEDIALICFAHPTTAEAIHEAALAINGQAIHTINYSKK